ncbi:MAG TPA: ATP-binding protein [Drouetiella sp.]
MKRRFSLFSKGVMLVAVPVLFEILFVIVLCLLVIQSQKQALEQEHILSNFQDISAASSDGYLAVFSSITYATLPTKQSYDDFISARNKYIEHVKSIQNISSHPLTIKSVKAVTESSKLALALLNHIDEKVQHNDLAIYEGFQYSRQAMQIAQQLRAQLGGFRNEYQNALVQSDEAAARFRTLLLTYVTVGILVSLIIAFGLCFYFSKSIVERLKVVKDNSMRIGAELPLNKPISGRDEITDLDKSLRGMSTIIAETRKNERAVLENASDIICTIDAQGRFASVNPASLRIWGYQPEDLRGRRCVEILAEDSKTSLPSSKEALAAHALGQFENRIITSDGSYKDMLWSVQKSEDEQSLFCVVHDITERKEAERFKQQLTAVVSHDLRTPLTSMQGALTLLGMGALGELPEPAAKKIQVLDSEIVRLIAITNDLLEMESLTAGKLQMYMRETEVADLFERCKDSVETFADQHGVKITTASTDLKIVTDADRLSRVLINLLGNAIKFSPAGETVAVDLVVNDDQLEVSVKDHGRGIPEGYHEAIFERFKQVEEADAKEKSGSGLGLAICKSIIEQLGGTIGVESTFGKGSRFWFRIPLICQTQHQAASRDPVH